MQSRNLEPLSRRECLTLMGGHPSCVGRIAMAGPRPLILPVNYALDGEDIIFRTDPGTKLHHAVHKSYVAFEVDWVEPSWKLGWSVVVRGQAKVVDDPAELRRLEKLPLVPWAEGPKEKFVRIKGDLISGRRITQGKGMRMVDTLAAAHRRGT